LIEENISAYCEPFGKALPPQEADVSVIQYILAVKAIKIVFNWKFSQFQESRPVTTTPTRSSVATCSSAGSELELLMPQRLDHQKERKNLSPNSDVDSMIANRYQS